MAYVRTVKTASAVTAVQIVHSSRRGSRDIEHVGSAQDGTAVELLKAIPGPASVVLYDVSRLCFETDACDRFREPGFSQERRLEP